MFCYLGIEVLGKLAYTLYMKKCTRCLIKKDEIEFMPRSDRPGKFTSRCAVCINEIARGKYNNNEETKRKVSENGKAYRDLNEEKERLRHQKWREANIEKIKEKAKTDYWKNREADKKRHQEYYINNKEKIAARVKDYRLRNPGKQAARLRKTRAESLPYRLTRNLSRRMVSILHGKKCNEPTKAILAKLGYTVEDLIKHIESQFQDGMTWENYGRPNGSYTDGWHIDHKKPCCSFDFDSTDHPQFKELWALSNLRPLWARDNASKSKEDRVMSISGKAIIPQETPVEPPME